MSGLLQRISEWANATEFEDFDKQYFFPSSHYRQITNQNRILVIGRKGTGKSALASRIVNSPQANVHAAAVRLASLDIAAGTEGNAWFGNYETLTKAWSRVILESIAELVLARAQITPQQKRAKAVELGISAESNTNGFLERVRHIQLDAKFLGVELGVSSGLSAGASPETIDQRNSRLRSFIEELTFNPKIKFVVAFDGLDEGYIQAWEQNQQNAYFRTVTGLIAAAIAEKTYFAKLGLRRNILPVVFIRSDIFERISYQQKAAWISDQSVMLNWDRDELDEFCRHRILQAANANGPVANEAQALASAFQAKSGLVEALSGQDKKMTMSRYVVDYSLGRPRDVVMFMKAAADLALKEKPAKGKSNLISKRTIAEARRHYGVFLKNEIRDELGGEYPIINILLNRLAANGTASLSFEKFREIVGSVYGEKPEKGNALALAERLFDMGFFGQLMSDGTRKFVFADTDMQLDESFPLVVHPCYAMALNIRSKQTA